MPKSNMVRVRFSQRGHVGSPQSTAFPFIEGPKGRSGNDLAEFGEKRPKFLPQTPNLEARTAFLCSVSSRTPRSLPTL
eukprot:3580943-Rhodomonas_salina.2